MNEVVLRARVVLEDRQTQETILAEALGNDLYELRTIPKLIPEFNYGDIVRAAGDPLTINEVVTHSGYQTLRVVFLKGTAEKLHQEVVHSVRKWQARAEMISAGFYAISVAPEGDVEAICTYLSELRQRQILLHEPDTSLSNLLLTVAQNMI